MPKLIEYKAEGFSQYLTSRGLSAYSLSRTSGVAEKTLRKMTSGHGPVRVDSVRKLSVALKLDLAVLVKMLEVDGVVVNGAHQ